VATIRDTALRDRGATWSSGAKAPRIRRMLPPAKYVASTAGLTSANRRWYRGTSLEVHSVRPPAVSTVARGSVSAIAPVGPLSVRVLVPFR
jgi:hypothetical protein